MYLSPWRVFGGHTHHGDVMVEYREMEEEARASSWPEPLASSSTSSWLHDHIATSCDVAIHAVVVLSSASLYTIAAVPFISVQCISYTCTHVCIYVVHHTPSRTVWRASPTHKQRVADHVLRYDRCDVAFRPVMYWYCCISSSQIVQTCILHMYDNRLCSTLQRDIIVSDQHVS